MSKTYWTLLGFGLITIIAAGSWYARVAIVRDFSEKTIVRAEDIGKRSQAQLLLLEAERRKREDDAKIVEVFVPSRDTKTCLRLLNKSAIDNQVIECNRDHVVKMRKDGVDRFKEIQGII